MKVAVCVLACAAVLSISAAAAQRGAGNAAVHEVSMDGTAFVPAVIRVRRASGLPGRTRIHSRTR